MHVCNLHWEWIFKKQNCYQFLIKISVGPALEKRGIFPFALSHKRLVDVPICPCSVTEFNTSQAHSEPWDIQSCKKVGSGPYDTDSFHLRNAYPVKWCNRLHPVHVGFDMSTDQTKILLLQVSSWAILTKAYGDSSLLSSSFFFFKLRVGNEKLSSLISNEEGKKKDCSVQAFG